MASRRRTNLYNLMPADILRMPALRPQAQPTDTYYRVNPPKPELVTPIGQRNVDALASGIAALGKQWEIEKERLEQGRAVEQELYGASGYQRLTQDGVQRGHVEPMPLPSSAERQALGSTGHRPESVVAALWAAQQAETDAKVEGPATRAILQSRTGYSLGRDAYRNITARADDLLRRNQDGDGWEIEDVGDVLRQEVDAILSERPDLSSFHDGYDIDKGAKFWGEVARARANLQDAVQKGRRVIVDGDRADAFRSDLYRVLIDSHEVAPGDKDALAQVVTNLRDVVDAHRGFLREPRKDTLNAMTSILDEDQNRIIQDGGDPNDLLELYKRMADVPVGAKMARDDEFYKTDLFDRVIGLIAQAESQMDSVAARGHSLGGRAQSSKFLGGFLSRWARDVVEVAADSPGFADNLNVAGSLRGWVHDQLLDPDSDFNQALRTGGFSERQAQRYRDELRSWREESMIRLVGTKGVEAARHLALMVRTGHVDEAHAATYEMMRQGVIGAGEVAGVLRQIEELSSSQTERITEPVQRRVKDELSKWGKIGGAAGEEVTNAIHNAWETFSGELGAFMVSPDYLGLSGTDQQEALRRRVAELGERVDEPLARYRARRDEADEALAAITTRFLIEGVQPSDDELDAVSPFISREDMAKWSANFNEVLARRDSHMTGLAEKIARDRERRYLEANQGYGVVPEADDLATARGLGTQAWRAIHEEWNAGPKTAGRATEIYRKFTLEDAQPPVSEQPQPDTVEFELNSTDHVVKRASGAKVIRIHLGEPNDLVGTDAWEKVSAWSAKYRDDLRSQIHEPSFGNDKRVVSPDRRDHGRDVALEAIRSVATSRDIIRDARGLLSYEGVPLFSDSSARDLVLGNIWMVAVELPFEEVASGQVFIPANEPRAKQPTERRGLWHGARESSQAGLLGRLIGPQAGVGQQEADKMLRVFGEDFVRDIGATIVRNEKGLVTTIEPPGPQDGVVIKPTREQWRVALYSIEVLEQMQKPENKAVLRSWMERMGVKVAPGNPLNQRQVQKHIRTLYLRHGLTWTPRREQ